MRISHFCRSPAERAETLASKRHAKRHALEKRLDFLCFLAPIDDSGQLVARQHEIFGHRHRRHQREMLVDHAETERMGGARIVDRLLAAADHDGALRRAGNSP